MYTARCGDKNCDYEVSKRRQGQAEHAIKRHVKLRHGHSKFEIDE